MTRYGGDLLCLSLHAGQWFRRRHRRDGLSRPTIVAALIPIVEKAGGRFTSWEAGLRPTGAKSLRPAIRPCTTRCSSFSTAELPTRLVAEPVKGTGSSTPDRHRMRPRILRRTPSASCRISWRDDGNSTCVPTLRPYGEIFDGARRHDPVLAGQRRPASAPGPAQDRFPRCSIAMTDRRPSPSRSSVNPAPDGALRPAPPCCATSARDPRSADCSRIRSASRDGR